MKKSIFFIFLFVVILSSLIYSMGHVAGILYKKHATVSSIQKSILLADERQKNIKSLERSLQEAAPQKEALDRIFADERSIVDFIKTLESMATAAGVMLTVQNATLPASGAELGPEFQIRIEGSFDRLARFLESLEVMAYQVSFSTLTMDTHSSSQNTSEGEWLATAKIVLLSFLNE